MESNTSKYIYNSILIINTYIKQQNQNIIRT